ncbi:prepilin-type N-terminal cleavage/methylation domain-containing protein [Solimonas aquatica]|uniref:Prepilin-type N-terminal cleavage/methylation domain-containing protein n=1 Tax=Solimonas aquatica TaxID=489703 RepID=A0A1H9FRJ2_9GAMM|nr:type IV pilin protein [Solimonas aquatica]SEQ40524.1 prepilin-type N-terminal cleavage/methylation domain-containing protein [Solimonas aquatica]
MSRTHRQQGLTLIELVLTLLLAALLAMMAVHLHQSSILRSHRALATRTLAELAAQQEQYRLLHQSYAQDFSQLLQRDSAQLYVHEDGSLVNQSDAASRYAISLQAQAEGFLLEARAVGLQLNDTPCQSWTLDAQGRKSADGSSRDALRECWP